jgi:hypothetical protein
MISYSVTILKTSTSVLKPNIEEAIQKADGENSAIQKFERDKTSLDITWIKDKSLIDLDNLTDPDVLAEEIIENSTLVLRVLRR